MNEVLTQKRRQQLRANNYELRDLERHLRSAVANKQLNEQLRNAKQLKESELREKSEENARVAAERELDRKSILKKEELERLAKKKLLDELNCQMNKANQKRRKEFEDTYKDREQMEKLMKQIQGEELAKRKEAELFRKNCKKEMEENYNDIRLKQQLEKERYIEENRRNLSYQIKCDIIKSEKELERKRILEEKEDLSKLLGEQLSFINLEKENRERLLLSLSIQECREKGLRDYKETLAKSVNDKKELCFEIEKHCKERKARKERFKVEEEEFRVKHLRYMEERDKSWQLSAEKRHRKVMDHHKELKEIIEQRRYSKANEIAQKLLEFEKLKVDNEISDLLVEEERVLMLDSVPRDLLSYLPPGVLKSSDKELLKFVEN